jgi:hypothetical protein
LPEEAAAIIWSDDLAVTTPKRGEHPPRWMMELAESLILRKLPRGVIVGSAVIEKVTRAGDLFEWHLGEIERLANSRKPTRQPRLD